MTPDDAAGEKAAAPAKQPRFTPVPQTSLKARVFSFFIAGMVKMYAWTLRIRIDDEANIATGGSGPVIWTFWHNRMLLVPVVYSRYIKKRRRACVLTSPSGDGALLAAVMRRFGLESVRGSSNKRAAQALVECRRRLLAGWDLGITPDGPRGPVYVAAPGILQLARLTQCPVMPVRVEYSKKWELKSWDRFRIPKPFSRVTITLAPVIVFGKVPLEEECRQLQDVLGGSL